MACWGACFPIRHEHSGPAGYRLGPCWRLYDRHLYRSRSRPATARGIVLAELTLALGGFALGTGEFASMGLLPDIARAVDVSIPTAGEAISAYALGVVVGAPLIAVAFARACCRRMLIELMLVFGVANGLTAVSSAFVPFLLTRFAAGLPHGAYFGFAVLAATSMVSPSGWAKAV